MARVLIFSGAVGFALVLRHTDVKNTMKQHSFMSERVRSTFNFQRERFFFLLLFVSIRAAIWWFRLLALLANFLCFSLLVSIKITFIRCNHFYLRQIAVFLSLSLSLAFTFLKLLLGIFFKEFFFSRTTADKHAVQPLHVQTQTIKNTVRQWSENERQRGNFEYLESKAHRTAHGTHHPHAIRQLYCCKKHLVIYFNGHMNWYTMPHTQ